MTSRSYDLARFRCVTLTPAERVEKIRHSLFRPYKVCDVYEVALEGEDDLKIRLDADLDEQEMRELAERVAESAGLPFLDYAAEP